MAETQTKILDIKVNYNDAINKIVEYRKAVAELNKDIRDKQKESEIDSSVTEKNARAIEDARAKIAVYRDGIQKLSKVTQNQIRQEESAQDSLVQMRAKLSNLTAQYDSLSQEMRNSQIGQNIKNEINDVTTALKVEEEATQRYYRNVGNYENSINDAFAKLNMKLAETQREYAKVVSQEGANSESARKLKKDVDDLQLTLKFTEETANGLSGALYSVIPGGQLIMKLAPMIGTGAKGMKTAFTLAGEGAKMLGKQLLALMANPIVAFLALVAGAIMVLVNGIKSSEENMNRWQAVMAPLQRALGVVQSAIQTLCGWILSVVEFGGKMMQVLMKFAEAATSIFPSVSNAIHNVNAEIENSIELARREAQLTKDNREFLVEEAKQQLEIAKLKNEANDTTKTAEERLKAAQAAKDKEQSLMDERLRLAKEELAIEEERAKWADNDAATEQHLAELRAKVYNAEKEYYDNTRKLNTQQNKLEQDIANERKKRHEEYRKQCEERAKLAQEASKKEMEALRALEDTMLELVEDGNDKKRQQINLQYDREIAELENRLNTEKNLTEKARQSITDTIVAKEQLRQKALQKLNQTELESEIQRQQTLWQLKIDAAEKGSQEELDLKLRLLDLHRDVELAKVEDDEEMKTALMQKFAQERFDLVTQYTDAQAAQEQKVAEQEVKIQEAKAQAISGVMKGVGSVLDAMGQKSKAAAKLSKVLALAEIAINTGKAIAAGTAQAQSVPYPANLVAIATTVATVLANVASAISTVKSAKFARGGKVKGAGTGTSDSIPAMLSNGEFVITAKATEMVGEPFLNALNNMAAQPNVITPAIGINAVTTTAEQNGTLADAIRDMHPVVAIKDINDGQARVKAIENLGNIDW